MFRRALKAGASHTRLLWQHSVRGTIEGRAERRVEKRFRESSEEMVGAWVRASGS
jgi:hypothetical protein